MNKKAIGFKEIGLLIIGLIVLVFVILFVIKVRSSALNIIEDSECRDSIAAHALLVKTTGEVIVPDIHCPTKYYTISAKKEEEVKKYIAEALKTCWGMWGRGELQLFKDEGYYCHICFVTDFKGKSGMVNGLKEYLIETPIETGKDLTYMDYLIGYSSEKANPELLGEIQSKGFADTIDTSKDYSIMFVYAKGEKFIKKFFEGMDALGLGTTGGGATTGLIVGTIGGVALAGAGVASCGTVIVIAGAATVVGGVIGYLSADEVHWVAVTLFSEYNAETLKKIGCQISPAKHDKAKDELG